MYFCIYEKTTNNTGWFYVKTLGYIDVSNNIELYDFKQRITHIEEQFELYKLEHPDYSYILYIKDYDPGDVDMTNR